MHICILCIFFLCKDYFLFSILTFTVTIGVKDQFDVFMFSFYTSGCKGKSIKKTLNSKLWRRRWYTRTYKLNGSDKVLSMRLYKNKSRSSCVYKRSYGFYGKKVWVRHGCRGVFKICIDPKGKKMNRFGNNPFTFFLLL